MRSQQRMELSQQRARARQSTTRALRNVLGVDPVHQHHGAQAALLATHQVEMTGRLRTEIMAQVQLALQ